MRKAPGRSKAEASSPSIASVSTAKPRAPSASATSSATSWAVPVMVPTRMVKRNSTRNLLRAVSGLVLSAASEYNAGQGLIKHYSTCSGTEGTEDDRGRRREGPRRQRQRRGGLSQP